MFCKFYVLRIQIMQRALVNYLRQCMYFKIAITVLEMYFTWNLAWMVLENEKVKKLKLIQNEYIQT